MSYCIVNPAAGYIYVNNAKAACTSIKTAIAEQIGVPFERVQWNEPHRRGLAYAVAHPEMYRFTFVRHPGARLVSCWADWCCPPYPAEGNYQHNPDLARLKGIAFEEFVRHACGQIDGYRNQHYAIQWRQMCYSGTCVPDDLFHLEDIGDVWPTLQERYGLPALKRIRTSEHKPWQHYFDNALRAAVEREYHEDFANLEYQW